MSAFQRDRKRLRERLLIADHQILRLKNISAGRASHREGKLRLRALRRKLDDVHLVQLFLPRHRHVAGGYARLIARHEIL